LTYFSGIYKNYSLSGQNTLTIFSKGQGGHGPPIINSVDFLTEKLALLGRMACFIQ